MRVFNAVRADFSRRLASLRAFAELDEDWRVALESALEALTAERRRRLERSAAEIADCLVACLTLKERSALGEGDAQQPMEETLTRRLQDRIRRREQEARDRVQSLYRHQALARQESASDLLETDIFTREGWELFGLSRTQLLVSGALSGAVAGGGVDVLLGGASLLLGAGIGALVGGASAWFGSDELAKVKVLGQRLGGSVLQVGPVKAPNFPWVLLGRAVAHHGLVAEQNHARREAISLGLLETRISWIRSRTGCVVSWRGCSEKSRPETPTVKPGERWRR